MSARTPFTSHKAYIAATPAPVQTILLQVQAKVEAALSLTREYEVKSDVRSKGPMMSTEEKAKGPASYFPSIEKKHGHPISHWLSLVAALQDMKHMERVAWLKSQHGFGHGHANAVVAHVLAARSE